MSDCSCRRPRSAFALPFILTTAAAAPAFAQVDLTVTSIEVNQTINTGALTLVAKNATVVRVRVGVSGSAVPVAGVDAELHVFSNGVEIPGSPFFPSNGPFTAPLSPASTNENDTLNFFCVPPQSNDVDLFVTVNPLKTVVESNYTNNTGSATNKAFVCRKMVDLAYVSVNYTPGGGEPPQNYIAPGTGDAFLRGIYKTGDWNYHRSPLGALTWTTNINSSNNTLLNTLLDIRNLQIPPAGYSKPEFIYGWLPGNPYSGNGQAIGVPGAAAFGNSETSRFQRTFAHEIGHLWGEQHNTATIGTTGFDVEMQLKDPLNLGPVMPTTKKDVMYAGQLTDAAWVNTGTFNDCINDDRSACTNDNDSQGGSGGASDAMRGERCLRVAGEYDHIAGRITLMQSQRIDLAEPTANDPAGDAEVTAYDSAGRALATLRVATGTARESCSGDGLLPRTPFYVLLPETIGNREIARVVVRDVATNVTLATQKRSRNAPVGAVTTVAALGSSNASPEIANAGLPDVAPAAEGVLDGEIEVTWTASDPDGDPISATLLYSPDGGSRWVPLGVNLPVENPGAPQTFRFPTSNVPQSVGANGLVKLRVSDGLNVNDGEFPVGMAMGLGTPPDVHVISPNNTVTVPQYATVLLHGSAWDIDEELLSEAQVSWTSSLDGAIGTGRLLHANRLSPGVHTITLTGTDSSGLSTSKTVTVTVTPRVVRSTDLNGDGVVDGADLGVLLGAWGVSGGLGTADINLDNLVDGADLALLLGDWE